MNMVVAPSTWVFLWACALGGALGVCYDVFRILRIAIPSGKLLVFVQDIVFFALVTVATFEFYQLTTDGIVRGYVLVGEVLGFAIYYFTIGALVFKVATALIHFIKKLLRTLLKWIVFPFRKLFSFVYHKMNRLCANIFDKLKNICKKLKYCLQKKLHLLYNHSNIHLSVKTKKKKLGGGRKVAQNQMYNGKATSKKKKAGNKKWRTQKSGRRKRKI